jgi:hypothetical protein
LDNRWLARQLPQQFLVLTAKKTGLPDLLSER